MASCSAIRTAARWPSSWRRRPDVVGRLILGCTYAHNVTTRRERLEAHVLGTLLRLASPGAIGKLALRLAKRRHDGSVSLSEAQASWLQSIMATNRAPAMRGATKGLITFDSRPWLHEIAAPTLVVAGSHDDAVPRHHYDALVNGIPGASGRFVDRASHSLIWTHTSDFADIITAAAAPDLEEGAPRLQSAS